MGAGVSHCNITDRLMEPLTDLHTQREPLTELSTEYTLTSSSCRWTIVNLLHEVQGVIQHLGAAGAPLRDLKLDINCIKEGLNPSKDINIDVYVYGHWTFIRINLMTNFNFMIDLKIY